MGIWSQIINSIRAGHALPRATLSDQFVTNGGRTLLSRAAWVPGLGVGVKSVTVYPENPKDANLPTIHGSMVIFSDVDGTVRGTLPSDAVTNLKTAGDSVLGSLILARPDASRLLILGAGKVAEHLVQAYAELMPHLKHVQLWNRTRAKAQALAGKLRGQGYDLEVVTDLAAAVAQAQVISSATMTHEPILRGDWVQPGTHVDLIGAFNKTMREGDDTLITKARLFCDCLDTTIDHIGEFHIPLQNGLIERGDVEGDFYKLIPGHIGRQTAEEITLFKNGGGAHLDLMTAQVIL